VAKVNPVYGKMPVKRGIYAIARRDGRSNIYIDPMCIDIERTNILKEYICKLNKQPKGLLYHSSSAGLRK
jgi:hypothetical protein